MEIFDIRAEGVLKINFTQIPVYILKDGRRAVNQSAVYNFFTGKPAKTGIRHSLSLSNVAKHLPTEMRNADEIGGKLDQTEVRLFFANELVWLCNAIILANTNQKLSLTWKAALPKAQHFLMLFGIDGVNKVIDHAVKSCPIVTASDYKQQISELLEFRIHQH